ncbi:RHS repeat-associated core domain-containing protein, partial [uncultured Treponema sp.]|uniref:RHS repeat domain-containing protein n=1 Tax=uncultured Treponema sp. TaxID=162155 RepID=UPI0028E1B969
EEHYGQSEEKRHQYYYHPDHLGSAQLVTDYEGNEYQRIEYTPYGELWVEKKTANEKDMRYLPYKFTAKEQDEETGLYYYGARYLDAKYSRWLSTDPAVGEYIPMAPVNDEAKKHNEQLPGMGGVFNVVNFQLYHYAGNNPVKYTDPDGRAIPIAATLFWVGLFTVATIEAYLQTPLGKQGSQALADAIFYGAESATKTVTNTVAAVKATIQQNVEYYTAAKAKARELTKEQTDKKSTGSYTIYFESGKSYSGKGGLKRACASAAFRSWANHTMPTSVDWTPSSNNEEALEAEYIRIQDHGGPKSRYNDADKYNYNEIQSPGEYFYKKNHGGSEYPRKIPIETE